MSAFFIDRSGAKASNSLPYLSAGKGRSLGKKNGARKVVTATLSNSLLHTSVLNDTHGHNISQKAQTTRTTKEDLFTLHIFIVIHLVALMNLDEYYKVQGCSTITKHTVPIFSSSCIMHAWQVLHCKQNLAGRTVNQSLQ